MKTLNDILKEHPEWGDMPVAVARADGELDYINGAGVVYLCDFADVDDGSNPEATVVFSGN